MSKRKSEKEKDALIETLQTEVKKMRADMELLQREQSAAQIPDGSHSPKASESESSSDESEELRNEGDGKYFVKG